MSEPSRFSALTLWLTRLGVPLLLGAIIGLTIWLWPAIHAFFENPAAIRQWIDSFGWWGPLVFVGVQVLQVIIFVIPGELTQVAGGYLFGMWLGTLLSVIGIALGAAFNFFLARTLGMRFVESVFGKAKVEQFERFINNPKLALVFFLLFLIPGLPKDALCYMAGLSHLKFLPFLILSSAARLPGILVSGFMGHAAGNADWLSVLITAGAAALLFGLGWLYREQVQSFLAAWTLGQTKSPAPKVDEPPKA